MTFHKQQTIPTYIDICTVIHICLPLKADTWMQKSANGMCVYAVFFCVVAARAFK